MGSITEVRFSQTSLLIQTMNNDKQDNDYSSPASSIKNTAKTDFLDISTQIEIIGRQSASKTDYSALEKKLGIDSQKWGVESVSDDIFNFAKIVYEKYKLNHSDEDSKKVLDGFYNLAKNSITQGYQEAKNFLGAMPADVAKLAEGTFNRTIEKLDNWYKSESDPNAMSTAESTPEDTSSASSTGNKTSSAEALEPSSTKEDKFSALQIKIDSSLQQSEELKNQILDMLKQQGIYLKESQSKKASFDLKG